MCVALTILLLEMSMQFDVHGAWFHEDATYMTLLQVLMAAIACCAIALYYSITVVRLMRERNRHPLLVLDSQGCLDQGNGRADMARTLTACI